MFALRANCRTRPGRFPVLDGINGQVLGPSQHAGNVLLSKEAE